jgi:hypothetical protein
MLTWRRGSGLLFLLLLPQVISAPAQADWETLRIDAGSEVASIELAEDLAAYEMDGDIRLYRIPSTGPTRVSRDAYDPEDFIIGLDADRLWYWAADPAGLRADLHLYDVRTGDNMCLFESQSGVDPHQGAADAGRAVILKDSDWFLAQEDRLEQLTFSGASLEKEDAWLSGDYLVWRAVAGSPGVYATRLLTKETYGLLQDNDPFTSLWVSGMHAAWVTGLSQGQHWVFVCRIDTGTFQIVGPTEETVPWQLAMDYPLLVWVKKLGPLWMVMETNLQDATDRCLYFSVRPVHTPRVLGDHLLFITENCPDEEELCSELNVLDRKTGLLTQLTYFGRDTLISSPRIGAAGAVFGRHSRAFPAFDAVYLSLEKPGAQGWALSGAARSDKAVNLALLLPPLAIAPWRRCTRSRRRPASVSQEAACRGCTGLRARKIKR